MQLILVTHAISALELAEVDHGLAQVVISSDIIMVEQGHIHGALSIQPELQSVGPSRLPVLIMSRLTLHDLVSYSALNIRIHTGEPFAVEVHLSKEGLDDKVAEH